MVNLPPNERENIQWLQKQADQRTQDRTADSKETAKTEQDQTGKTSQQKDVETKETLKDTIKSASTLQSATGKTGAPEQSRPTLEAPKPQDFAPGGKTAPDIPFSSPHTEQTLAKAMADNAIQDSSFQTLKDTLDKGKLPKGTTAQKFVKQVASAVKNPSARVPQEAKTMAQQILKQAAESLGHTLNVSPDEAQSQVEEATQDNQELTELYAGKKFNDSFNELLKNVSPNDRNALTFAKNNPEYAKFLPNNLQSTFSKMMKMSTGQTRQGYNIEGKRVPYNTEMQNTKIGADAKDGYNDKLLMMKMNGEVSEKDANRLENLYYRPDQDLPDDLKEMRDSLLKESYDESFAEHTGLKENVSSVEQDVFKEANEFKENFEKNLENLKPLSDEDKELAKQFLTDRDPTKFSGKAKEAFETAYRETANQMGTKTPPSPFTMRRAEAFSEGMQKGLEGSNLPKDVQQQVLKERKIDPEKFKDFPNANEITEQLNEVLEQSFAEMRNSIATPFGPLRNVADHRHFLNVLRRAMVSEKISPSDAKKILDAVKSGNIPKDLEKVVKQLLGKVNAKVTFDRGLSEDWAPDQELLSVVEETMDPRATEFTNNLFNSLDEQTELYQQITSELLGPQTAMAAGEPVGAGQPSGAEAPPPPPPESGTSSFAKFRNISTATFIGMVTSNLNQQREVSYQEIASNAHIQLMIQGWQRDMIQNEMDKSYLKYQDQKQAQADQGKEKHGPLAKIAKPWHSIKLACEIVFFASIAPFGGFVMEAAIIQQLCQEGWSETAAQNLGTDLFNSVNAVMNKMDVPPGVQIAVDWVTTVAASSLTPLGPLIALQMYQDTAYRTIDVCPISQKAKIDLKIAVGVQVEVIKISAMIALMVLCPPAGELAAVEVVEGAETALTAANSLVAATETAETALTAAETAEEVAQVAQKAAQIATDASRIATEMQTLAAETLETAQKLEEAGKDIQEFVNAIEKVSEAAQKATEAAQKAAEVANNAKTALQTFEAGSETVETVADFAETAQKAAETAQKASEAVRTATEGVRNLQAGTQEGYELRNMSEVGEELGESASEGSELSETVEEAQAVEAITETGTEVGNVGTQLTSDSGNVLRAAQDSEQALRDEINGAKELLESLDKLMAGAEKGIDAIEDANEARKWGRMIENAKQVKYIVTTLAKLAIAGERVAVSAHNLAISKQLAQLQREIASLQAEIVQAQAGIDTAQREFLSLNEDTRKMVENLKKIWTSEENLWMVLEKVTSDVTGALYDRSGSA